MSKPFEPYTNEKNDEEVKVDEVITYPMKKVEFEDNIVFYYTIIDLFETPCLILGIIRNGNLEQMLTPSDEEIVFISNIDQDITVLHLFDDLEETHEAIEKYLKENKTAILEGDTDEVDAEKIDVIQDYSSLLEELKPRPKGDGDGDGEDGDDGDDDDDDDDDGDEDNEVEKHLNEMINKGINRRLYLVSEDYYFDGETHIYLGPSEITNREEIIENIYQKIYKKTYPAITVGQQAEDSATTNELLKELCGRLNFDVVKDGISKFGGKKTTKKRKSKRKTKKSKRKTKKSKRKTNKSKRKTNKSKRKTKKMHGGVSFNDPVDINNKSYNLPPLNTYENDPQNTLTDSRLLPSPSFFGGKKRKTARRNRKMRGGSLIGTDILTGLNTTMTNGALAFGTTGGTEFMAKTLTTEPISSGDAIIPKDTMVPLV